jgi:hypothetical protein
VPTTQQDATGFLGAIGSAYEESTPWWPSASSPGRSASSEVGRRHHFIDIMPTVSTLLASECARVVGGVIPTGIGGRRVPDPADGADPARTRTGVQHLECQGTPGSWCRRCIAFMGRVEASDYRKDVCWKLLLAVGRPAPGKSAGDARLVRRLWRPIAGREARWAVPAQGRQDQRRRPREAPSVAACCFSPVYAEGE